MARGSLVILIGAVMAATAATADHQIPATWGTCKRSDPKLDDCLRGAVQRAVADLKGGNGDLAVKPLDPMMIQQFHLNRGGNGPLNIDMTFSDASIEGMHLSKVKSVKTDLANGKIDIELTAPTFNLKSKYKVRGRVLVIPINGEGVATIKMDNAAMKVKIEAHPEGEFLHVDSLGFDINPDKTVFKFVNPAHAQQAELLSRVVSENDKSIIQELRPTISNAFSKAFKEYADAVFSKVPFDKVFPQ